MTSKRDKLLKELEDTNTLKSRLRRVRDCLLKDGRVRVAVSQQVNRGDQERVDLEAPVGLFKRGNNQARVCATVVRNELVHALDRGIAECDRTIDRLLGQVKIPEPPLDPMNIPSTEPAEIKRL